MSHQSKIPHALVFTYISFNITTLHTYFRIFELSEVSRNAEILLLESVGEHLENSKYYLKI